HKKSLVVYGLESRTRETPQAPQRSKQQQRSSTWRWLAAGERPLHSLAAAGARTRVTLLEQFPVPHSRGSSHGHSRITRYAYKEAEYARLMRRAFPLWSRLESLSGQRLFINCGMASLGSGAYLRNISEVLESNSMPLERLSGQSLASRFPRLAGFRDCVLDPSAGILLADRRCALELPRAWWSPPRLRPRDGHRAAARRLRPASPFGQRDGGCGVCRGAHGRLGGSGGWWRGRASCCRARPGPAAAAHRRHRMYWRLRRGGRALPYTATSGRKNFQLLSACTTGRTWTRTSGSPGEQREPYYLPELADFVKRWFQTWCRSLPSLRSVFTRSHPIGGLIVDRHPSHRNIVFVCGCSGQRLQARPCDWPAAVRDGNRPAHASQDLAFMSAGRFKHGVTSAKL
uniref:Sarcosine oxidasee (formaldehyde-forming) n=1 Tax=Macrostomum lignano TaxID=282301 RepID=A0A1I8FQJ1_9PLAT